MSADKTRKPVGFSTFDGPYKTRFDIMNGEGIFGGDGKRASLHCIFAFFIYMSYHFDSYSVDAVTYYFSGRGISILVLDIYMFLVNMTNVSILLNTYTKLVKNQKHDLRLDYAELAYLVTFNHRKYRKYATKFKNLIDLFIIFTLWHQTYLNIQTGLETIFGMQIPFFKDIHDKLLILLTILLMGPWMLTLVGNLRKFGAFALTGVILSHVIFVCALANRTPNLDNKTSSDLVVAPTFLQFFCLFSNKVTKQRLTILTFSVKNEMYTRRYASKIFYFCYFYKLIMGNVFGILLFLKYQCTNVGLEELVKAMGIDNILGSLASFCGCLYCFFNINLSFYVLSLMITPNFVSSRKIKRYKMFIQILVRMFLLIIPIVSIFMPITHTLFQNLHMISGVTLNYIIPVILRYLIIYPKQPSKFVRNKLIVILVHGVLLIILCTIELLLRVAYKSKDLHYV